MDLIIENDSRVDAVYFVMSEDRIDKLIGATGRNWRLMNDRRVIAPRLGCGSQTCDLLPLLESVAHDLAVAFS